MTRKHNQDDTSTPPRHGRRQFIFGPTMRRLARLARTPILVTLGMAVSLALGAGITSASAASSSKPEYEATYQMYANVTADGALGPSYDVTNVLTGPGPYYLVYFKHPIANCAEVLQIQGGYASGTQEVVEAYGAYSPDVYEVEFDLPGKAGFTANPFSLVVTCKS